MTPIRHFVFDIGRVLIHYDPHLAYLDLIPDAAARERFLSQICSPAWNLEQDRGRSWSDAEDALIEIHPDKEHLIRSFRRNWSKMIPRAQTGAVAVMRNLVAAGADVTLLTNFAADTYEEARRLYPFLDEPRGVTVSGRAGAVKPAREIYAHHEKTFGLDPGATLFVDDSAENVDGARRVGWSAIQYENPEQLARALSAYAALERFEGKAVRRFSVSKRALKNPEHPVES